uniref:AlNc14C86G5521 protein n=1 Tax=Albugo laibachii Nc14 TaxID=890382 RepID=F0WFY8_9STRA|nr:AlNc14C86G5521 [Albugo laibachii Nc14]|eukprot:CCA20122.1 AlNc14C86G5521 [Albugo laibachii Nc14]
MKRAFSLGDWHPKARPRPTQQLFPSIIYIRTVVLSCVDMRKHVIIVVTFLYSHPARWKKPETQPYKEAECEIFGFY